MEKYNNSGKRIMMMPNNTRTLLEYKEATNVLDPAKKAGWKFGLEDQHGKIVIIPFSAKSRSALEDTAKMWMDYQSEQDAKLVADWLGYCMPQNPHRLIILTDGANDFKYKLRTFIKGMSHKDVIHGEVDNNFKKAKMCFLFPGQGQQYWHMGRQLYANEPVYRNIIDRCDGVWKKSSGYSFLEKIKIFVSDGYGDVDSGVVEKTSVRLVAIVANQIALCELMMYWGINPDVTVGSSLGEIAAVYAAGGMSLEECIANTYIRATAQEKMDGVGSMAAAKMTIEEAELLVSYHHDLYIACLNSPNNITFAGGDEIIKKIISEHPTRIKKLRVSSAFHTPYMSVIKDELIGSLEKIYVPRMVEKGIIFFSSVTGHPFDGPYDPIYWWKNIFDRVNLVGACRNIFKAYGSDTMFLEISSSEALLNKSIPITAQAMGCTTRGLFNCGFRDQDDHLSALRAVAAMHVNGYPVNWKTVTMNSE